MKPVSGPLLHLADEKQESRSLERCQTHGGVSRTPVSSYSVIAITVILIIVVGISIIVIVIVVTIVIMVIFTAILSTIPIILIITFMIPITVPKILGCKIVGPHAKDAGVLKARAAPFQPCWHHMPWSGAFKMGLGFRV